MRPEHVGQLLSLLGQIMSDPADNKRTAEWMARTHDCKEFIKEAKTKIGFFKFVHSYEYEFAILLVEELLKMRGEAE